MPIALPLLIVLIATPTVPTPDTIPRPVQLPDVSVLGTDRQFRRIPGAGTVVDRATLTSLQPTSLNQAIRGVPGAYVRDEEGIGLRANIGIRGLNPTRSTTVLMLEDGVPFAVAPYGDNSTYYVPPIARFDGVEVLRGSGQIAYGPRTIGGVVNLQSPAVPDDGPRARVGLTVGNYGLASGQARLGTGRDGHGVLADLVYRRAGSARASVGTTVLDGTIKGVTAFGPAHRLTLKGNAYRERSEVTYSGLREEEYAQDPFLNPFANDSMFMDRASSSLEHRWLASETAVLTTRAYVSWLSRDWWRQSSNSAERPNDSSDPACGGMANLLTTCGNQGRLRDYTVGGVEPRLLLDLGALGSGSQLEVGVRFHVERQERRQENGASPNARTAGPADNVNSGVVEDNLRRNHALAAFLQPRLEWGTWTVTPGLRLEAVWYERVNALATPDAPPGATGRTALMALIPGLGTTWNPAAGWTLFAGLHRGFAPPRTEDIITASGGVVDLEAEESWNAEAGFRGQPARGLEIEATAFQLDFSNQVIPASVAGGTGATLTSAGETLHRGLELAVRVGSEAIGAGPGRVGLDLAWTWLATARFTSERYAYLGTTAPDVLGKVYAAQSAAGSRTRMAVKGNRLPYAPAYLVMAGLTWDHPGSPSARLEAHWTGRQFTDPVNTGTVVPDGQQGKLPGYVVWNLMARQAIPPLRATVQVAVRNLLDHRHAVDRTRGLLPGMPRMVQAGLEIEAW